MKSLYAICPVCGSEMVQDEIPVEVRCSICGEKVVTNYSCPNGHYHCHNCGYDAIFHLLKEVCMNTDSRNPVTILEKMVDADNLAILGCKQGIVCIMALMTAYNNCAVKKKIDLSKSLDIINERAKKVQVSMCKMGGFCTIPIVIGVAFQGVLHQTRSLEESRLSANALTGLCMSKMINENVGGSKDCCIRNSYICTIEAARYLSTQFWVDVDLPSEIKCKYSVINPRCNKDDCPFYHGKKVQKI